MLLETKVDGEHCRDGVSCKPSSDMDSCAVYDRSDCSRDEQLHNNGLLTSESRAAERLSQGFHQCECMEARDPGANLGVASSPGQDLDECKKCKPEDPLLSSQMQTDHSTQRETKEFGETRFEELEETNQFLSNQEPGLEDAVDLSDSFEDLSQSEAGSGELVEDEVSNHSFCGEDGCSDVNDSGLPEEFENFDDISQDSCEGIEQIPGADDDLSQNCYEVVELETDEELPDDLEQDIEDKGDKDLSLESYEVVELENNKCGNEFQGNLSDEDLERDPNEGRATIETFGQVLNLDESTADVAEGLTELCNFDLSEFSKMPEVAEESEISAHANSVNVIFCREDNSSDCSFKTCPEDSVASAPSSSSSAVSDKSGEGDSSDEQTQWESFEEEEEEEEEVGEITEETKPASDFVVEDHFGFFDSDDLYRFSQKQSYISCFDGGDVHERLNYEQRETEKQNLRNITQCLEKKLTIDQQEELEELREVQEEFLEAVFEESYETETFEDNIDAKTSQDEAIYQKEEEEDHVDNNSDKTEQEPTHFYQERIKNSLNKHQELSPNADGSQPSDDEAPDRDSDHGFPPCAADISVEGDAYCDSSDVSDLADDLEDGFCVSEDVALLACSEAEPYCLCLHLNPADQEDEEDQEEEDRELEDQNEEEDVKVEDLEEYLEVKDMEEDLEEEDLEEEDLEVVNVEDLELEDLKVEDLELEDLKVEDLELEDLKVEDLELEDLKVEDLELEDLKVEDVKVEDLKVEDLELEDLDQEDLKVEDLEQEDLKVEDREQEVLEVEDLEDEVLDVEDLEEEDLEEEVLDGEDLEEEDLEVEEYYVLEMTSIQTSSLQSLRDFLLDVELKMDIRSAFWDKSESLEAELAGRGSQGALLGAPEGAPVGLIHSVPESVKKTESEEDGDSEDEGSDSETEECECEYCVPPTDRALCEPLLPQLQCSEAGKMCVVIDLDETLVHSSFKPLSKADFVIPVEIDGTTHQVYVLKRPHVDLFLQRMGQLFECVLFTASLAKYADPVSDLLDPSGAFRSRLFREDCVFHRGNYVKDLSRLGRDLRRVIIIDNSPFSYAFQPHNAVPVVSWFDDVSDTELLDLIPFFEKLSLEQEVYAALKQQTCSLSS